MVENVLDIVRRELRINGSVYYAGEIVSNQASEWMTESVAIIIAPAIPLLSADELNRFMLNLIHSVNPSCVDHFHRYDKGSDLALGKLYFDETIGKVHESTEIHIESDEPDILVSQGFAIGTSTKNKQGNFTRRTWVRPYPTQTMATAIFEYESGLKEGVTEYNDVFSYLQFRITPEQMGLVAQSGRLGFFGRIRSLVGRG